jgi:hypothetical protein
MVINSYLYVFARYTIFRFEKWLLSEVGTKSIMVL